jgi:predicted phosphodiesterase
MRVAALYDIHGMFDALEAALAEVEREDVDAIVFGGDVVGGPQPAEVLARLREVDRELIWVRGNGDRALGPDGARAVAEGEEHAEALRFTAERLEADDRAFLAQLPPAATLDVGGLGPTLFCHATPQNDLDLITAATPDRVMLRAAEGVAERTIICGHTHMQFDRRVDRWRVVNAGSVGLPYGAHGANWLALGPGVEHRRTPYDTEEFASRVEALDWPKAEEFAEENIRDVPSEQEALEVFEPMAAEQWHRRYAGSDDDL